MAELPSDTVFVVTYTNVDSISRTTHAPLLAPLLRGQGGLLQSAQSHVAHVPLRTRPPIAVSADPEAHRWLCGRPACSGSACHEGPSPDPGEWSHDAPSRRQHCRDFLPRREAPGSRIERSYPSSCRSTTRRVSSRKSSTSCWPSRSKSRRNSSSSRATALTAHGTSSRRTRVVPKMEVIPRGSSPGQRSTPSAR